MAGLRNVSVDANPAETIAAFSNSRWPSKFIYGLTIFLSAFLLFEIQPIIAKIILPWFGGSAAVWSVCLLFFQTALLLGYLYSHLLIRYSRSRVHISIHLVLLAASILMLPVLPKDSWKPLGRGDPTWQILLLLVATIGLPYFLLSATSPLVQAWYARARRRDSLPVLRAFECRLFTRLAELSRGHRAIRFTLGPGLGLVGSFPRVCRALRRGRVCLSP